MTSRAPEPVMGRAAAVVLCLFAGIPGVVSLLGVDVSGVVADVGDGFYRDALGVALVAAAVAVCASPLIRDAEIAAQVESAGLLAHAVAASAYLWALLTQADPWTNSLLAGAYFLAGVTTCTGRAFLLALQVVRAHMAARQ